MLFDN